MSLPAWIVVLMLPKSCKCLCWHSAFICFSSKPALKYLCSQRWERTARSFSRLNITRYQPRELKMKHITRTYFSHGGVCSFGLSSHLKRCSNISSLPAMPPLHSRTKCVLAVQVKCQGTILPRVRRAYVATSSDQLRRRMTAAHRQSPEDKSAGDPEIPVTACE